MIPKGEYVLSRVKAMAVHKAKENESIRPLALINPIEQWEFDYEMDKEYFPEKCSEGDQPMNELIQKVEQWSKDKGLDKADSAKQYLKVSEEAGEVAAALARNDKEALKDGIGDVVVTLIILAQQNDMTLEECLDQAYGEISGRVGKMINGVFVKESDLKGD